MSMAMAAPYSIYSINQLAITSMVIMIAVTRGSFIKKAHRRELLSQKNSFDYSKKKGRNQWLRPFSAVPN